MDSNLEETSIEKRILRLERRVLPGKKAGTAEVTYESLPAQEAGGVWTEDANSPIDVTGVQSTTYTLAETYDLVRVHIQAFTNEGGGNQHLYLQLNGNTGNNYRYTRVDGSQNTVMDNIRLIDNAAPNATQSGSFDLTAMGDQIALQGPFGRGFPGDIAVGSNDSEAPPLTSLTFGGNIYNMGLKARVYGWNGEIP